MSKKVSLVLSSGGARGLAHIGVIEELLEQGYDITAVSGASIGAAIGGIYAAGKLDKYKEWIIRLGKMDVFNLFDFNFSSTGFIKGERVFTELKKVIGDGNIEDFPIPFTAVATDINSNEEIWIRKGSLFKAIRASVAIPSILTPIYEGNKIIVDGGVSSPIPIDPIMNQDHDMIVVVNLHANIPFKPKYKLTTQEIKDENDYLKTLNEFKKKWSQYFSSAKTPTAEKKTIVEKLGYFSLFNRSIEHMEAKLIEYTLATHNPELVINISKYMCGTYEFYKAKELIEEGRLAARKSLKGLKERSLGPKLKPSDPL